jgi:hypothetical protein
MSPRVSGMRCGIGGVSVGQGTRLPRVGKTCYVVGKVGIGQGTRLPRVVGTRCGVGRVGMAKEQCRRELAEQAAMLAESALAKEQHCQELEKCAASLADLALAKEQYHQESTERAAALTEWRWLRSSITMRRRSKLWCQRRGLLSMSKVFMLQHNAPRHRRRTNGARWILTPYNVEWRLITLQRWRSHLWVMRQSSAFRWNLLCALLFLMPFWLTLHGREPRTLPRPH